MSRYVRVDAILEQIRGETVLDIGCAGHEVEPGSIYWLHGRLVDEHPDAVGIELDTEKVEQLRQMGYENVRQGDAETFDLSRRFDTIVAGELIEHLANPGSFLRRCKDHLAEGGRLVLSTPYPFSLLNTLYAFLKFPRTVKNPEHTLWFCPMTLKELAHRHGFRIAHWDLIESYRYDDRSALYRLLTRSIAMGRWLIPKRLRGNVMLFVLALDRGNGDV